MSQQIIKKKRVSLFSIFKKKYNNGTLSSVTFKMRDGSSIVTPLSDTFLENNSLQEAFDIIKDMQADNNAIGLKI